MTPDEISAFISEDVYIDFEDWSACKIIYLFTKRHDVKTADLVKLTGLSYEEVELIRFTEDYKKKLDSRSINIDHVIAVLIALRMPYYYSEIVLKRYAFCFGSMKSRDWWPKHFLVHCSHDTIATVESCNYALIAEDYNPLTPLVPRLGRDERLSLTSYIAESQKTRNLLNILDNLDDN